MNTVWYNNKDFSFLISMIIIVILSITTFRTGLPGFYELVVSFSVIIILYYFGRSIGWFSAAPQWLWDDNFIGLGGSIVIFALIIGYAVRPDKEKSEKK